MDDYKLLQEFNCTNVMQDTIMLYI